jgi:hypothetical protein
MVFTFSLRFAAYSPPAYAADVTVVATPGTSGVDASGGAPATSGGPGGDATATPGPTRVTLRMRQAEPACCVAAVSFLSDGNGGTGGSAFATATTSTADGAGDGFASRPA